LYTTGVLVMDVNFELKPWILDYAEDFAENANNADISEYMRDAFPHPCTKDDAEKLIKMFMKKDGKELYARAIVVNNHAVGNVGIFLKEDIYRKSAEIAYWISEKYRGSGIVTKAINESIQYVFEHFDVIRIFAEPFADNSASRRVLEKNGFQLEGIMRKSVYKRGVVHDSCMYALVR